MDIKRVIVVGKGLPSDQEVIKALSDFKVTYVIDDKSGGHLFQGARVTPDFFVHHGDAAVVLTENIPEHLPHRMPVVSPYNHSGLWNSSGRKLIWKNHAKLHNILSPQTLYWSGGEISPSELQALPSRVFLPVSVHSKHSHSDPIYDFHTLASSLQQTISDHGHAYIERHIVGRVLHACVLRGFRGQELYVTPIVEKVGDKFEIVHKLNDIHKKYITDAAKLLHQDLGLGYVSQFDFILDKKHIYLRDVVAHPSIDAMSPLMASIHSVGSSLVDFWKLAIEHSKLEFRKKGRLS